MSTPATINASAPASISASVPASVSFSPENQSRLAAIRPERRAALAELFRGDLEKDAARIAALFTDDAVFQIGAAPPVVTRAGIGAMLAGFFAASPFTSLEHELLEVYDLDEALLWRAHAVYRLPGGSSLSIPYLNRVRFAGGRFADYRVHIDLSPLRPA